MTEALRIDVEYLAKTYGLEPPIKARLKDGLLVISELEPEVEIDLNTIRAIGEEPE